MLKTIELSELGVTYYAYSDKKNKRTIKRLKELGVKIHSEGKRRFVMENEFLEAYHRPKNSIISNQELVLTQTKNKQMKNVTLKEKEAESGLYLICKCKKPYRHEGLIICRCSKFKYLCRIYMGKGNPEVKEVLDATNILDAKVQLNTIKSQIEKGTYVKKTVTPVQQQVLKPIYNTIHEQPKIQDLTLLEAIDIYLNYLDKKGRSKENNQEAKRLLLVTTCFATY